MINQRGVNEVADRTWIYNTFGFKTLAHQKPRPDHRRSPDLPDRQPPGPGPRVRASVLTRSPHRARARPVRVPVRPSRPPTPPATHGRARRTVALARAGTPWGGKPADLGHDYTINLCGAWGFPMATGMSVAKSGSRYSTRPTSSAAAAGTVKATSTPCGATTSARGRCEPRSKFPF